VAFAVMFIAAKLAWTAILGERRHQALSFASYTVSFLHGCAAILATSIALTTTENAWHEFEGYNHSSHNTALMISLGYFIAVSFWHS